MNLDIDNPSIVKQIDKLIGFETWLEIILVTNDSNVIWSISWNAVDYVVDDFLNDT